MSCKQGSAWRKHKHINKHEHSLLSQSIIRYRSWGGVVHTWLYSSVICDSKGGDFLFWWHACIPEHLHVLLRPLRVENVAMKAGKLSGGTKMSSEKQLDFGILEISWGSVMTVREPNTRTHKFGSECLWHLLLHSSLSSQSPPVTLNSLSLPVCWLKMSLPKLHTLTNSAFDCGVKRQRERVPKALSDRQVKPRQQASIKALWINLILIYSSGALFWFRFLLMQNWNEQIPSHTTNRWFSTAQILKKGWCCHFRFQCLFYEVFRGSLRQWLEFITDI